MADDHDTNHLAPEQYREHAKLARYTAKAMRSTLLRQDLLDIAAEYDELAETAERLA